MGMSYMEGYVDAKNEVGKVVDKYKIIVVWDLDTIKAFINELEKVLENL